MEFKAIIETAFQKTDFTLQKIIMMKSSFAKIVTEDCRRISLVNLPWFDLSGSTVVVSGAAGFIGSSIVRLLLSLYPTGLVSRPVNVIGLVRNNKSDDWLKTNCLDSPHLNILPCDLAKSNSLDLGHPDYVLHAASLASPKYYSTDPVGTLLPNAVGTLALLEASRSAKRFLYVSSSEVYGRFPGSEPIKETDFGTIDPVQLRSCYSEGKRFGENLCVSWNHMYGLETLIVRPFHTYGPGLRSDDSRVFADFAFAAAKRQPITLTSSGSAVRAYCYISDAIAGIFSVLLLGEPSNAYNLANPGATTSVRDLATMLSSSYNIEINFADPNPEYIPSTIDKSIPDIQKIQSLGWSPSVGLLEGFERFVCAISE